MTRHLTSDELVAALDHALTGSAAGHLEGCDSCRAALSGLEASLAEIRAADQVPEPSPLFWEHLTGRVRAATNATTIPTRTVWWRPVLALGAAAAVVLVMVLSRSPAPAERDVASAVGADTDSEAPWSTMVEIASTLSRDDVQVAVASAPDAALAVNDLTPKEREAFVRLLGVEMGGVQ